MKNWKRILAFLLCITMVFAMSLTALAKSSDDDDDEEDYDVSDVSFDVSDTSIYVTWSVGDSKCTYSVQLYDSKDFKSKNKVGSESTVSYTAEKCDVTEKILKEGSGTYYAVVKCKKKAKGSSYKSAWGKETISSDDLSLIRKNRTSSDTTSSSSSSSNGAATGVNGGPGVATTGSSSADSSASSTGASVTAHWNALDGGRWSYTTESGSLAVGWYQVNGSWYYSGSDGIMYASSWIESASEAGAWYYVGADGAMLTNTVTPDGYTVDADGVWRS